MNLDKYTLGNDVIFLFSWIVLFCAGGSEGLGIEAQKRQQWAVLDDGEGAHG